MVNPDFTVSSELLQKQAYLICLRFYYICSYCLCLIIYNGMLSKELSISILLGYDKLTLAISKVLNILAIPAIVGLVLTIGIIEYLVAPSDILGFRGYQ